MKYAKRLINNYIVKNKYSLRDFQQEILDDVGIESSIEFGENDIEVSMEIWEFKKYYIKIDSKGNILKAEKYIEKEEIFHNTLEIDNLGQLSYSIYQDEYVIDSEDTANDCLKYLNDNLDEIYHLISLLQEDTGCLPTNIQEQLSVVDLYQLGDIINFVETIKIKEKK